MAAMKGRTLVKAQRKGKHMWLDFDRGPSLMLHFGERHLSYKHVELTSLRLVFPWSVVIFDLP